MLPRGEMALLMPDREPGRPPDAIQVKGRDVTQSGALLRPCSFQTHHNVWSLAQAYCGHMRLNKKRHHRNPYRHVSATGRNRRYLHFTALHQLNEVSKEDVSVPLAETTSIVGNLQERCAEGQLLRRTRLNEITEDTSVKTKHSV